MIADTAITIIGKQRSLSLVRRQNSRLNGPRRSRYLTTGGPFHGVLSLLAIAEPNCLVFQVQSMSAFAFVAQRAIKAS